MNEIWANRLIAGTKAWGDMPVARRVAVKEILAARVNDTGSNGITADRYKEITGEDISGSNT